MPTIELPDFWVLFNENGRAVSSTTAVLGSGEIYHATAQSAWEDIEPIKRNRERDARKGYQMLGINRADWKQYWDGELKPEPVTPEKAKSA